MIGYVNVKCILDFFIFLFCIFFWQDSSTEVDDKPKPVTAAQRQKEREEKRRKKKEKALERMKKKEKKGTNIFFNQELSVMKNECM